MKPSKSLFIAVLLVVGATTSMRASEVLWLDRDGKGYDMRLNVDDTWPLSHFAMNRPYWDGQPSRSNVSDRGGPARADTLQWWALPELASIKRLGDVGGIRVYQVAYTPAYHAIVWDRGGWAFSPAAIIAGDTTILVGIHTGRVFKAEGRDLLHVRIQYEGTGHIQQSLFFGAVRGNLVQLQQPPSNRQRIDAFLAQHQMRRYHRGLGFCEDSLVEEILFEYVGPSGGEGLCPNCRITVRYTLQDDQIVVDDIELGSQGKDCVIFPPW